MVTLTVKLAGATADPCKIAYPIQVVHGRSQIGAQPDPPTTDLEWLDPVCPYKIGDRVEIWATVPYNPAVYDSPSVKYDDQSAVYDSTGTGQVTGCRFVGVVAAMTAHNLGGPVTGWTLAAVGIQAQLGFRTLVSARPQETDFTRVQAIATAVGVPITARGTTSIMLAADTVDGDALTALHDVCESSGGLLWQTPAGQIVYGGSSHRLNTPTPVGVLDCHATVADVTWDQAMESVVNEVVVTWGTDTTRGTVTHRDDPSVAGPWGLRSVQVNTVCATASDATQLGLLILARRAQPFWGMSDVLVDAAADDPTARLTAALDVSVPILVPLSTVPGPLPAALTPMVVEGWAETFDADGVHDIQLALSDQKRWVTTQRRNYGEAKLQKYSYWRADDYLNLLVKVA